MTLQEAYERGRDMDFGPRSTILKSKDQLATLDCESVTKLLVSSSYDGDVPDISVFPNLVSFETTKPLTKDYLLRQDFSKLKTLCVMFDIDIGYVKVIAPQVEDLTIWMCNQNAEQMDLFAMVMPTIDFTDMPKLERLHLRYPAWCGLKMDPVMNVRELIVYQKDDGDLSFLSRFNNLEKLTLCRCGLTDLGFIERMQSLRYVDVSYNQIRDFCPLYSLPYLETVKVRRNAKDNNAEMLRGNWPLMIINDEDDNMEILKYSLNSHLYSAYQSTQRDRLPNPKRPKIEQRYIDATDDVERFRRRFHSFVCNELKHRSNPKSYSYIPEWRMLQYIRQTYPFIDLT